MRQESPDALPRRRWWLKPLLIAAIVLVLAGGAAWVYRATEPGRLAKQARTALDNGDLRSAAIALRRAVAIAPQDETIVRLMAELTDKVGASTSVAWHEQVVSMNPESQADRTALIGSALRLRQVEAAEEALANAPASFRATGEYEALRGMVAIGKGHWRLAENAFAEAVKRDPKRETFQFNHALARAQNPDAKVRQEGIAALQQLTNSATVGVGAQRSLVRVYIRERQLNEALALSEKLSALPNATFSDHLMHLDLLHALEKPELAATMDKARAVAVKVPADLSALLMWSVYKGSPKEARAWTATLDPALLGDPAVVEAQAEVIAATNDWPALAEWTGVKRPWANGEGMRNAFAALAADKSGNQDGANGYWQLAIQTGTDTKERAMPLAYFAHRAGWRTRMLDTLWSVASGKDPEWALRMLHRLSAEDGNTQALHRVAKRLAAILPNDAGARNNVVVLGLLLGEDPKPLLELARGLHLNSPSNPIFASTYAFALHANGKSAEGLALFDKLKVEERQRPEIALYHAVVLAGAGKKPEAAAAAALARKAKLLPEEERLLTAAGV